MKLSIADCRLSIKESLSCRSFARSRHDGRKLVGLGQKSRKFSGSHRSRFDQQFEPKCRLIRLFFDRTDFGNEFGLTAGSATGPVICRHGSAAADDLLGNRTSGIVVLRNGPGQFNDSERKSFSSSLQFGGIHGSKLQTQSAIGNRQSAMLL
jgi:hypothetical protein